MSHRFLISVVDDDESVRESLEGLLKAIGYGVEAFSSAEKFLGSDARPKTNCLILDIRMPGMSGPELHLELMRRGELIPTIFITSYGSREVVSRDLANGAVDCLVKPFTEDSLLKAISQSVLRQAPHTRGTSGER
jgi:FixJ family two-component response regulator